MKRAKLIALPKNETEDAFPTKGAIRTIAALPILSKLFEHGILIKLNHFFL